MLRTAFTVFLLILAAGCSGTVNIPPHLSHYRAALYGNNAADEGIQNLGDDSPVGRSARATISYCTDNAIQLADRARRLRKRDRALRVLGLTVTSIGAVLGTVAGLLPDDDTDQTREDLGIAAATTTGVGGIFLGVQAALGPGEESVALSTAGVGMARNAASMMLNIDSPGGEEYVRSMDACFALAAGTSAETSGLDLGATYNQQTRADALALDREDRQARETIEAADAASTSAERASVIEDLPNIIRYDDVLRAASERFGQATIRFGDTNSTEQLSRLLSNRVPEARINAARSALSISEAATRFASATAEEQQEAARLLIDLIDALPSEQDSLIQAVVDRHSDDIQRARQRVAP